MSKYPCLSSSIGLISGFVTEAKKGTYDNNLSFVSQADSITQQMSRVQEAQSNGATVHWSALPGNGGSFTPVAYYADGTQRNL